MLSEIRTGIIQSSSGAVNPARGDSSGATVVTDGHGKYVETTIKGNMFFASVAAAAPTAYVGASGGTPLLAVHNPTGSNFALAIAMVSAAPRVVASAVGHTDIALWAGLSVVPTGTQTSPKSALTFASGGVGLGFSNAALTGSTALNLALVLNSYFWGTSVGVSNSVAATDVNGLIILMPGMQAALGATVALTSLTWDASIYWEQIALS